MTSGICTASTETVRTRKRWPPETSEGIRRRRLLRVDTPDARDEEVRQRRRVRAVIDFGLTQMPSGGADLAGGQRIAHHRAHILRERQFVTAGARAFVGSQSIEDGRSARTA